MIENCSNPRKASEMASRTPDWKVSNAPVPYSDALTFMEQTVAQIAAGSATELVWLLEHPPLYTAGTSAKDSDLLEPGRFPVYPSGRGGQYTYHGPGQRVGYVMLDLNQRGRDLRAFVHDLEEWLIRTLDHFNVKGERRPGRVGIWVVRNSGREEKIAAIGLRVRRWISFHGISLNVDPDLSHFDGIIPCGLESYGVTSLSAERTGSDHKPGRSGYGPGDGFCRSLRLTARPRPATTALRYLRRTTGQRVCFSGFSRLRLHFLPALRGRSYSVGSTCRCPGFWARSLPACSWAGSVSAPARPMPS
jgi:lipoyl(octanoyl) transferase